MKTNKGSVFSEQGMILIISTLILGVISLTALFITSQGSLSTMLDANETLQSVQLRSETFGCLEELLIRIQANPSFTATSITAGTNPIITCTVNIQTPQSGERLLTLSHTQNNITRRISTRVRVSPVVILQITEPSL